MSYNETFGTVSSTNDLMSLSPKQLGLEEHEQALINTDLHTITNFDSNVTMSELTMQDDMYLDSNSMDYLTKCTSNKSKENRGRDSLYVKFDPLYAKTTPTICVQDMCLVDVTDNDHGHKTCNTDSVTDNLSPSSKHLCTDSFSQGGIGKLTQKVSPVVLHKSPNCTIVSAPTTSPVRSVSAPTTSPARSVSAPTTSPARSVSAPITSPARSVSAPITSPVRSVSDILTPTKVGPEILVNLYGNSMPSPHSPKYKNEHNNSKLDDWQSLRQIFLNQDQELRHWKYLYKQLEHSVQSTKDESDNKIRKLEAEVDTLKHRECELTLKVTDKKLCYRELQNVTEAYEKTINLLIDKKEKLASEKEQALNHLACMESTFNDLLTKYEKSKVVINELKDNQKASAQRIAECEREIKNNNTAYNTLKQVSSDTLKEAKERLDNVNKSYQTEVTKLKAIIKKHEITISSLQDSLSLKTRENEKLTCICDKLINDVDSLRP